MFKMTENKRKRGSGMVRLVTNNFDQAVIWPCEGNLDLIGTNEKAAHTTSH